MFRDDVRPNAPHRRVPCNTYDTMVVSELQTWTAWVGSLDHGGPLTPTHHPDSTPQLMLGSSPCILETPCLRPPINPHPGNGPCSARGTLMPQFTTQPITLSQHPNPLTSW